jgi:hypothetical protein
MLTVVMLSAGRLNVVMLSVVAPRRLLEYQTRLEMLDKDEQPSFSCLARKKSFIILTLGPQSNHRGPQPPTVRHHERLNHEDRQRVINIIKPLSSEIS